MLSCLTQTATIQVSATAKLRRGSSLTARVAAAADSLAASDTDTLPLSPEVQAIVDAQGIDMSISALAYLPNNEARVRTSPTHCALHQACNSSLCMTTG